MFTYFNRSNRGARNFSTLTYHSSSIWTMSSSEHCWWATFQIYNVQNLKITRITTFRICHVVYQAGSRWDPKCVFNFLRFFERTLYKSNYIIFILSWCGTHTKIRSNLVDIVTAGSQKITLWGPQRTPLGILRVKSRRTQSMLHFQCSTLGRMRWNNSEKLARCKKLNCARVPKIVHTKRKV